MRNSCAVRASMRISDGMVAHGAGYAGSEKWMVSNFSEYSSITLVITLVTLVTLLTSVTTALSLSGIRSFGCESFNPHEVNTENLSHADGAAIELLESQTVSRCG